MSLMYTEEQKALIALVKEMAENEIKPYVKDADEKGECPKELYKWGVPLWKGQAAAMEGCIHQSV